MSLHTILRHQICAAIVLSVVQMMTHGVCGRPDFGAHTYIKRHNVPPGLLLGELLADANEDQFVSALQQTYQPQQLNYITKWPALRDLILSADYDDDTTEDNDSTYTHFIERLRQLTPPMDTEEVRDESSIQHKDSVGSGVDPMTLTMLPLRKVASSAGSGGYRKTMKQRDVKKNIQYMSPCHFKICNMGRKRNARYFYKY